MRSCLGSKCFDEPVNGIERIGILAPFMSGGETLSEILRQRVSNDKVTITYDSHVPAYGYGKNHGWTRIIRLVRSIESHAAALTKDSPTAYEAQVFLLIFIIIYQVDHILSRSLSDATLFSVDKTISKMALSY